MTTYRAVALTLRFLGIVVNVALWWFLLRPYWAAAVALRSLKPELQANIGLTLGYYGWCFIGYFAVALIFGSLEGWVSRRERRRYQRWEGWILLLGFVCEFLDPSKTAPLACYTVALAVMAVSPLDGAVPVRARPAVPGPAGRGA